jgi:hypothetical protein
MIATMNLPLGSNIMDFFTFKKKSIEGFNGVVRLNDF